MTDVRHAFIGGNMGTGGSVAFMFKRLGVLGADEITEAAIEAGADDIVVYPMTARST